MSNAPLEAVLMNRSLANTGKFDPELLQTIVDGRSKPWKAAGPSVRGVLSASIPTKAYLTVYLI